MNMIMTCIFFSPIIPHAIPLALVGSFFNYWFTKYMLLRHYKMPEMFSDLMASFFSNFMPWVTLVWSTSFFTFMYKLGTHYNTDSIFEEVQEEIEEETGYRIEKDMFEDGAVYIIPFVTLGLSAFFVIAPFRTCLNRFVDENSALD